MRAVVHDRYGPPEVLRLEDVEPPVPKDSEVRVRIHATTVSRTDCALRAGEPLVARVTTGLRRPRRRILGSDLAGEVDAVGANVTEFEAGDRVFGINPWRFGAHAELIHRSADDRQSLITILFLQRDKTGDFLVAGTTPRRPKIEDEDFALQIGGLNRLADKVL